MPELLTVLDGSGREPRPIQRAALEWLEASWDAADVLALQLPTGVGKSLVARTIQRATRGRIVVPSNLLMGQYTADYCDVNSLKGAAHYHCDRAQSSCEDAKEFNKPCAGCPYQKAKNAALQGASTFFNPMSLYYLRHAQGYRAAEVLIVDEAHNLVDMVMDQAGRAFGEARYGKPTSLDQLAVLTWLQETRDRCATLASRYLRQDDKKRYFAMLREIEGLDLLLEAYKDAPQDFAVYQETGALRNKDELYTCVKPTRPPPEMIRRFTEGRKIVLLSATLLRADAETLAAGRSMAYVEFPSPIPAENRRVRYRPIAPQVNYQTSEVLIARWVLGILAAHPGENAIIHATYSMAGRLGKALQDHLPGLIRHTADTKVAQLERFKRQGGVFLASGCAEGIDLAGDLCRVNIVPVLFRLNPTDPVCKKRMAAEDGRRWYDLQTLRTLIQQAGRSTRGPDDKSTVYVGDPALPRLISARRADVPKSFLESLIWSSK